MQGFFAALHRVANEGEVHEPWRVVLLSGPLQHALVARPGVMRGLLGVEDDDGVALRVACPELEGVVDRPGAGRGADDR